MLAVLAEIYPFDPANPGTRPPIFACSVDDARVCHSVGSTWWPAISRLPTLRYDLFSGDFDGNQISAPSGALSMQIEPWPDFARYIFADARIVISVGQVEVPGSFVTRFDGRITTQPDIKDGVASIEFAADDRWLDAPLLPTYAGTTGAEGPADLKGQVKPLSLGAPRYVGGKLIDSVNNVFQLSAYGVHEVEAALERLARFGAPVADYASYSALVAATVPPGRWATARVGGYVRFGAPTNGQISFLVKGDDNYPAAAYWARRPGDIVNRLAELSGGTGKVNTASLIALNSARPYNISLYLEAQTTAREQIQGLVAGVNAVAGVSWTGQLFAVPVAIGAPSITLAADGSALPPVASVEQIASSAPWQRLAIGAARAWVVHPLADVAFTSTLIDMGAYSSATTYRDGNLVQDQGSTWLYINPAPTAGNAPPTLPTTSNSWWKILAQAGADGTPGSPGVPGDPGAPGSTGATGPTGDNGLSAAITPGAISLGYTSAGSIKGGQLPSTLQFILYDGNTDVHEGASYTIATSGCTASVSNTAGTRGRVTVTAVSSALASVLVTATYGSRQIACGASMNGAYDGSAGSAGSTGATGPAGSSGSNGADGLGSANRMKWTRFEFGTRGYVIGQQYLLTTRNFSANSLFGHKYISCQATATASGQQFSIDNGSETFFKVTPGERLAVSSGIYSNANSSSIQLFIWWFDASGNALSGTPNSVIAITSGTISLTSNFRLGGFVTVPSGAVQAGMTVYFVSSGAQTMDGGVFEQMVCEAAAGQTVLPKFTPGTNAADGATSGANINPAQTITGAGTFNYPYSVVVPPGGTVSFGGSLNFSASGSSINVQMQVLYSTNGGGSYTVFPGSGTQSGTALAGEPNGVTPSGSYTNGGTSDVTVNFRTIVTKSGGGTATYSSGSVRSS